jgi:hypothetical protein
LWPNLGFAERASGALSSSFQEPSITMGNKIITEADRRATPQPPAPKGVTRTSGQGQMRSLERGVHTRSKKNPGKRTHKGG